MKKYIAAATFAVLATSSTFAADLGYKKPSPVPVFTAFSWTGAYVGVDAGYVMGKSSHFQPAGGVTAKPEPAGSSGGIHAGYRYQLQNNFVLGAEVRAFMNIDTKKTSGYVGLAANSGQIENRWGGDARLSVGYAFDRVLVYAAGGLALADYKGCTTFVGFGGACINNSQFSDTRLGWTVGAGLGYAVTNNIQLRLDYSYAKFGNKNHTTIVVPGGITRVNLETHAVRAGLSYKF